MAERLLISSGDVIDVQLTSETLVVENARPQGKPKKTPRPQYVSTGRISNRMRLFLRETDGRERNYDIEGARIGVREGHACAVVRGRCRGIKDPIYLMLINLSTDEHDIFENGLVAYLSQKPFFGPIWKALGAGAIMLVFGIVYSQLILGHHRTMSVLESFWWSLFFTFLSFPVFWWIAMLWDSMTARRRFQKARSALLEEVQQRLAPQRAQRQSA